MSKLDEFKEFAKNNPVLINHIKNGNMSWQKFYEIYDLYGEDKNIWEEYFSYNIDNDNDSSNNNSNSNFKKFEEIVKMAKNVDIDKVQDGLTSLQKTLTLFGDLFISKENNNNNYNPRPLYRKFDD